MKIMDELGFSFAYREKLYCGDLLRFLGKTDTAAEKNIPIPDDNRPWSAVNPDVTGIIEKWYAKLGFPRCCDKPFREALHKGACGRFGRPAALHIPLGYK